MDAEFEWDFFIAHAGPDLEIAKRLYLLLKDRSKVFLDACSIELGSDWDTDIASAQMKSRVMVVLVSAKTPHAYYQREEIATAIVLARKEGSSQKLVPVFLDSDSVTSEGIPYGLRVKHGLIVGVDLSLQSVADRLIGLIAHKIPTIDDEDTGIAAAMGVLKHHVVELALAEGVSVRGRWFIHDSHKAVKSRLLIVRQTTHSLPEILDLKVRSLASTR